jgi:hypothetical protein
VFQHSYRRTLTRGEEGWRTPNDSWLDLEEEDGFIFYHINVIVNEDMPRGHVLDGSQDRKCKPQFEESNIDCFEGHWGSSAEEQEEISLDSFQKEHGRGNCDTEGTAERKRREGLEAEKERTIFRRVMMGDPPTHKKEKAQQAEGKETK